MGEACTKSENVADEQRSRPPTIEYRLSAASGSRKSTRRRQNTGDEAYAIAHLQTVLADAYKSDLVVIRAHIQNGFPVDFPLNAQGWTLIHVAAQTGNLPLAQLLMDHDCDVDTQEVAEGWTPLMIAAINNTADVAELLVKYECDLTMRDKSKQTAEDLAVKYRSAAVSRFLSFL